LGSLKITNKVKRNKDGTIRNPVRAFTKNVARPKTLLCANSNNAADNLAQRLTDMKALEGKFVRIMNEKLEDVQNICKDTISNKPYSIYTKIIGLP
jgi:hypothetical protein